MRLLLSVLSIVSAVAIVSSAEAQPGPFCSGAQSGVEFIGFHSEELASLPNIKVVRGTRYFCSAGRIVGSLPDQVEIRDSNNSCATLFEGQIVPISGGVIGPTPCPGGFSSDLIYFGGTTARGLLHKATYCLGSSSYTIREFANGVQVISRPSGFPDCL